jgi:hypothetical protein
VTFSYTQVSQYLRCPRSYRYRYLDGWREKESRASLCFGRCFEKALAAFFEREDAGAVLFKEWGAYRDVQLEYSHGDDWEKLLRQGIGLLEQFAEITESAFANPNEICRRNSFGRSQTATSLWPTSMPLGIWTARSVCSNGKPPVLVIPTSPRG